MRKVDLLFKVNLPGENREVYLDKSCFNVFVVQELGENKKFLAKKLISKVDCSVHDSRAVSSDRVRYVSDVDCVQMLVV